ncbi:uncharacterized protein [Amphiura filiformis]|uniref:uncharacterized protein n=1 Tax=Amphiura filiformis TaxID=82378 RepID=UPI003B21FB03
MIYVSYHPLMKVYYLNSQQTVVSQREDSHYYAVCENGLEIIQESFNCYDPTCEEQFILLDNSHNLTSPGYPNPYPPRLDCTWIIFADKKSYETLIIARVKQFELEKGFDFLTVGNGDVAGENEIVELTGVLKVRTITSSMSSMWFALKTDNTGNQLGYRLELEQIPVSDADDVCKDEYEYNCGSGFCVTLEAECDRFVDCYVNQADEKRCAYTDCPGSYLCAKVSGEDILKCVTMEEVCDGRLGCDGGDDETRCDIKRCPEECKCAYQGRNLKIDCSEGWSMDTINNMAKTTNTLTLTGGNISAVEPGLFKGLFELHTLSLERNSIDHLEQDAFDGLTNLTWLDLSFNNISRLASHTFRGLPQLIVLVLTRGSRTDTPVKVDKGGFSGLSSLKNLVYQTDWYPTISSKRGYDYHIQTQHNSILM